MTHAIVLIEAERSAMPTLGGQLADVEGVAEAYSVTGEWDFVAIMRVREPEELAPLITGRLAQLEGIRRRDGTKSDFRDSWGPDRGVTKGARRLWVAIGPKLDTEILVQ